MSDSFYTTMSSSYTSPRSSAERVIPISSTTYVNPPRPSDRVDAYTSRPRRSTLTEPARPSSVHTHASRSRPAIVQGHDPRPSSPLSRSSRGHEPAHNPEYYVTPASTSAPRREHTHKKVYSIDDGNKSHLVADIDINPARSNRRNSVDRHAYRVPASPVTNAPPSSHRNSYHSNGALVKREVDIGTGYSYTDPAGMYRDTEPRRRTRAGSVEGSRNRPSSMILESFPQRSSTREQGPPVTSRGLDRYNETLGLGLHRGGSLRDPARAATHSPYQDVPPAYPGAQDHHNSSSTKRHSASVHQASERRDTYPPPREAIAREPYDERRDPRDVDRSRVPPPRDVPRDPPRDLPREAPRDLPRDAPRGYEDRSIGSRGFGIRNPSLDRHGPTRGSDESLNRREAYLERSAAPDPRDLVQPRAPRDDSRREQERRDYEYAKDLERQQDRDRPRDREHREPERKERDRLREDQPYMSESERDKPRSRRDGTSYRDQDRDRRDPDRRNPPQRDSAESLNGALPAAAAIGGLGAAAAAAAYGAKEVVSKTREREKDRGYQSPSENNREEDKSRRHRDQREYRMPDGSPPSDRERRAQANGEKESRPREPERDRVVPDTLAQAPIDPDDEYRRRVQQAQREPPSQAPVDSDEEYRRRIQQAQREPPIQAPVDPDEEYRRRVQQAQREIASTDPDSSRRDRAASEPSPDSDYRRRERPERSDRHQYRDPALEESQPTRSLRRSSPDESAILGASAAVADRGEGGGRDTRVRIVDPPSKDDKPAVKSILRRPTDKFPEDPHPIREGVAPLKDVSFHRDSQVLLHQPWRPYAYFH